jgi:hypothetical protein
MNEQQMKISPVVVVVSLIIATLVGVNGTKMPSLHSSLTSGHVDCEQCKTVVRAAMVVAANKTEIAEIIEVLVKYILASAPHLIFRCIHSFSAVLNNQSHQ